VSAASPPRDQGLTLVDLTMAVTIMAVIAAAALVLVATFLRNDTVVAERLDSTRDLRRISTFLPDDVGSAVASSIDTSSATPSACSGYTGGGFNVLTLAWSETFGSVTTQYRVSYRVEGTGSERVLVRVRCSGTSVPATATTTTLVTNLASWPATWAPGAPPVAVVVNGAEVTVTVTTADQRTLTIAATSENPDASLN
jgi:type II secretory pathway component PulJ